MPKWTFLPMAERAEYFHKRHMRTRNLRKFAYKAGMTVTEAQVYLDKKLERWYKRQWPTQGKQHDSRPTYTRRRPPNPKADTP